MARLRQIVMATATFSAALGNGFVMQNGDALANRFSADSSAASQAPRFTADDPDQVAAGPEVMDALMEPEVAEQASLSRGDTIQGTMSEPIMIAPASSSASAILVPRNMRPAPEQLAPVQLAALQAEPEPDIAPALDPSGSMTVEVDCVPAIQGTAQAGAMVLIDVVAPCFAEMAFTVHHQGMMFSARTDADGAASLLLPVLAEVAVVIAAFENGDGAVATTEVPDFADFDRAVLQWEGLDVVTLSALEAGAAFGEAGHIHRGNPGDTDRLNVAEGGYLIRLGDPEAGKGLMAEVYTFPSGQTESAIEVFLMAEAEITSANCGKELSAQSLQVNRNGGLNALDLTMVMPDCDAVGDFLILQNMFEDLTIASR